MSVFSWENVKHAPSTAYQRGRRAFAPGIMTVVIGLSKLNGSRTRDPIGMMDAEFEFRQAGLR